MEFAYLPGRSSTAGSRHDYLGPRSSRDIWRRADLQCGANRTVGADRAGRGHCIHLPVVSGPPRHHLRGMDITSPVLQLYGLFSLAIGTLAPRLIQPVVAVVLVLGAWALAVPEPQRSFAAQRWLETRYDRSGVDHVTEPAGIIVLGGGLFSYVVEANSGRAVDDRGRGGRISGAAALARRFPRAKLIHTGSGEAAAREVFEKLGVSPERILVEDRSETTYENATFTAALVSPQPGQRWILVTSASHIPRAMATFRSAGFEVVAYPVDFEADPARAMPQSAATAALSGWPSGRREVLSILGYLAMGRISILRLLI